MKNTLFPMRKSNETRRYVVLKLIENDWVRAGQIFGSEGISKAMYHLKILEKIGFVEKKGRMYRLIDKRKEFVEIAKEMSEILKRDEEELLEDEDFENALKRLIGYGIILMGNFSMRSLVKTVLILARVYQTILTTSERFNEKNIGFADRKSIEEFLTGFTITVSQKLDEDWYQLLKSLIETSSICMKYFRRLKSSNIEKEIRVFRECYEKILLTPDPALVFDCIYKMLNFLRNSMPEKIYPWFEKLFVEEAKDTMEDVEETLKFFAYSFSVLRVSI